MSKQSTSPEITRIDKIKLKRELEQQAQGVEDYANSQENGMLAIWMIAHADKLRQQAEELE
jgi:hypothetical protein